MPDAHEEKKINPIGGQAVINGVMMRSKSKIVVAVRKKDRIIHTQFRVKKHTKFESLPFVRGVLTFFEMMQMGMKALFWSGNQFGGEEEFTKKDFFFVMLTSLVFVSLFFVLLPFFAAKFIVSSRGILFNLVDGMIRIAIFIIYIALIARMKDIRTLFMYHGAEHKAVNCFEDNNPLTAENVAKYKTTHPRCGTSYIMIVFIISILMFSVITSSSTLVRILLRFALIPVIMSVSYEILRLAGKFRKNIFMKILVSPGIALQKLTTKEPNRKQIEVAIYTLKKALQ
jgi:uncharacterized protein YqhQ